MQTNIAENPKTEEPYHIIKLYEDLIHDLKTPLSLILSSLQQLEGETKKMGMTPIKINEARRGLYRVMKLLGDVSDRAKMNHGKLMPRYRNIDLVAIVREIVELTRPLSDRKEITLNYIGRQKPYDMAVDKELFERILLNLLSNAIKFSDKQGEIRVDLQEVSDSVVLTVKDNGKGVADNMMDQVFIRYAHEESMRNKKGEGIGLPIVKELTELMGGTVFFTSSGGGTEISVRLPIFMTDEQEEELSIDNYYSHKIVQIELSDDY